MSFENNSLEPNAQDKRKFILMLMSGIYVLLLIVSIITRVNMPSISSNSIFDDTSLNSSDSTSTDTSGTSTNTTSDASWVPAGYTQYDNTFAWTWVPSSEAKCQYTDSSCWNILVVTSQDCPGGVYGEISIYDKNDVQIDYTNDTTGAVYSGSKVKLSFDTFNTDADTAKISKLSCHSF